MSSNNNTETHQAGAAHQAYWQSRARIIVIIINACWFLTLAMKLLTLTALLYIVLGICRVGARAYWITTAAFGIAGGLFLLRRLRNGTLMTWRDGLVYLEDRLGLESALSSALDGAANWPPPKKIPRLFRPRLYWLSLSVLAWGIAWQIQSGSASSVVATGEMPSRGKELGETIDKIEEQQLVDPVELEKLKQNMDDLAAQGPEEWFSHESMEAMDGLQERLDAAIDANQQALNNLEEAFAALKNQPTDSRSGPEGELHQKMDEALGNLSSGALPLDPQLTKQLQELANPMGAGSDPEKAIQALKGAQQGFESLKKQRENDQGSPNRGSGETKPGGKEGSDKHNGRHSGSGKSGTGENDGGKDRKKGDGASGTSAGKEGTEKGDGVSRGPGEAPLNLFEKPPSMTSQSEVELESDEDRIDDSGEVIDVIRRTPQVLAPDENSGGRDVTLQKGVASATWNDSLTPDEEETLKKVLR